jgi:hypothetical protein
MTVPANPKEDATRKPLRKSYYNLRLHQIGPKVSSSDGKAQNPRILAVHAITGILKNAFDKHIRNVSTLYPSFLLQLWVEFNQWGLDPESATYLGFPPACVSRKSSMDQ